MHIQYSYNSNVSILLVSLLSRASGSFRTTPFHFFLKFLYTCLYYTIIVMKSYSYLNTLANKNIQNHSFQYKLSPVVENVAAWLVQTGGSMVFFNPFFFGDACIQVHLCIMFFLPRMG